MRKLLVFIFTTLCFCGAVCLSACDSQINNKEEGKAPFIEENLPQKEEEPPYQEPSKDPSKEEEPSGGEQSKEEDSPSTGEDSPSTGDDLQGPPTGEGQGQERPPKECTHVFSEWEVIPPTCEGEGKKSRKCTLCEKEETESIPALGHNFEDPSPEREEPTCTKEGYVIFKCQNEGCEKTQKQVLPPLEHDFSEGKILKEPTCTEKGERERTCKLCGNVEKEEIPALGHDLSNEFKVTKEPTCEGAGEKVIKCARCSFDVKEEIPALGHKFETKREEPTCTLDGKEEKVCSVCGKGEKTVLPALGHEFGAEEVLKEPTCEEEGEKVKRCVRCEEEEKTTLSALGHDFAAEFTVDEVPSLNQKGSKSKHCLRAGCGERTEVTELDMNSSLPYSIKVMRKNGAPLTGIANPQIFILDENNKSVKGETGFFAEAELPIKNYTARIQYIPDGFQVENDRVTLTPNERECVFYLEPQIREAQKGATYAYNAVGSVLRNHSIRIIGCTAAEDKTVTIKELLQEYKAIFINCYFTSCHPCMNEIYDMVNAYNATDSLGNKYGDDIAMIMLPINETEAVVRRFKNEPNLYSYTTAKTLPFMMALQNDLLKSVTSGFFPTSYVIDSEGVVTYMHTGSLSEAQFKNVMEENGLKYYKNLHSEDLSNTLCCFVPEAILPCKYEIA